MTTRILKTPADLGEPGLASVDPTPGRAVTSEPADPLAALTDHERLVIFAALGDVTSGHPWADTARALEARLRASDGSRPGQHDDPPPAVLDDVREWLALIERKAHDDGMCADIGDVADYILGGGWSIYPPGGPCLHGLNLDEALPHIARAAWAAYGVDGDLLGAYAGVRVAETALGAPEWLEPADRGTWSPRVPLSAPVGRDPPGGR